MANFTLRGRKSDLIISGGFNIYPREIEDYILEQEGVAEVAVVGISHETRGEMPVAYIVPGDNYNGAVIEEKCKKAFASFKVPRSFIVVDSLRGLHWERCRSICCGSRNLTIAVISIRGTSENFSLERNEKILY